MFSKIIFGVFILIASVGVFAFKENAPKKSSTLYFQFKGTQADGSSYIIPGNWEQTTEEGIGCSAGSLPCVVEAMDLPNVTDEISFANYLNSQSDDGEEYVDLHFKSTRD